MNSDNAELKALYEADQEARKAIGNDTMTLSEEQIRVFLGEDTQRKNRICEIINAGLVVTGRDFYHAAMIYHHGTTTNDIKQAHEYATRAWHLGEPPARWLTAATCDRLLMYEGKPQKYGTQYDSNKLWEIDPRTTDEERVAMGVLPRDEIPKIFPRTF